MNVSEILVADVRRKPQEIHNTLYVYTLLNVECQYTMVTSKSKSN